MTNDIQNLLCTQVGWHLAAERDYLEAIRRCVLDWPAGLVGSPREAAAARRMAELDGDRGRLWQERERLLAELQTAFDAPTVRRFSAFDWDVSARERLESHLREVRGSVARLSGAIRASGRTLRAWSEAVTELLAGLTGDDPRAGRYSSAGRRVDAAGATMVSAETHLDDRTRLAEFAAPRSPAGRGQTGDRHVPS
jgi:hypothetical protein